MRISSIATGTTLILSMTITLMFLFAIRGVHIGCTFASVIVDDTVTTTIMIVHNQQIPLPIMMHGSTFTSSRNHHHKSIDTAPSITPTKMTSSSGDATTRSNSSWNSRVGATMRRRTTSSDMENGRYVYKIFYENFDSTISCRNDTTMGLSLIVGIQGYVSEEIIPETLSSSSSKCIDTTSCIMNPFSTSCLALQQERLSSSSSSSSSSSFSYTISPRDRRIFSCDAQYINCVQLDLLSCFTSLSSPECNYVLVLPSDIVQNPSMIQFVQQSQPTAEGDSANIATVMEVQQQQLQQSYQLFYSGTNCDQFVGLRGLTKGENKIPGFYSDNNSAAITCSDAMSCLLNPSGEYCTSLGGADGTVTFISDTQNGTVYSCDVTNPSTCAPVSDQCFQYPHYPMCSMRWVSATKLFTQPSDYIYPSLLLSSAPTTQQPQAPITVPPISSITTSPNSPSPATVSTIRPTSSVTTQPNSPSPTLISTIRPTSSTFIPNDNLQDYGYIILYTDQNCRNNTALMIHPIVLGEHMRINGRLSPTDSCIDEAICVVKSSKSKLYDIPDDATNRTCSSMEATDMGFVYFVVPPNQNSVNQCNNRYGNDTCSPVDTCIYTGLIPSCHLVVVTTNEIQETPNQLLRNTNYGSNASQSGDKFVTDDNLYYQIFYSDDRCTDFVALNGLLLPNGSNESVFTTSEPTIACHDAVACIINPKSTKCKQLLLDYGLPTKTTQVSIHPKNSTNICYSSGHCEPTIHVALEQQQQCTQSAVLSTCFSKVVQASTFFDNPRGFIAKRSTEATIHPDPSLSPSRTFDAPSSEEQEITPSSQSVPDTDSPYSPTLSTPSRGPSIIPPNSDITYSLSPTARPTFLPTQYLDWDLIHGITDDNDDDDNARVKTSPTNKNGSLNQDNYVDPLQSSDVTEMKDLYRNCIFTALAAFVWFI